MAQTPFGQDQFEQMTKAAAQQAEDMMSMWKSGFDACMKSTNIMMDKTAAMMKELSNMGSQAREKQAASIKQFMSCKTLNDMTETSTKVAQETMEDLMSNATSMSEKTLKAMMDTAEPINDQMTKSMQSSMKKAKDAAKAA